MANDIQFRRVHGRIVPIHINPQQKQGAAGIAAGAAVATGAGLVSAKLHREAAHFTNAAMNYRAARAVNLAKDTSKARRAAGQFKNIAAKNILEAKRFHVAGKNVQTFGLAAGSSLIAAGVDKLLPKKIKENKMARTTADASAGFGAAFMIRSAYYKMIAPGSIGTKGLVGLKLAGKRVFARGIKL